MKAGSSNPVSVSYYLRPAEIARCIVRCTILDTLDPRPPFSASAMIPKTIPVMTLPGTVFFPRTLLPLHIFEPRYRLMLAETLRSHRIMAVTLLDEADPTVPPAEEKPHRIATAGVIRACQKNDDGTSNLILEGLERIEIVEIVRERPFRLIQISSATGSADEPGEEAHALRQQLLRVLRTTTKVDPSLPQKLADRLEEIQDPSAFCDLLVFSLAENARFKQRMLELFDPGERLRQTYNYFRAALERRRLGRRLQGSLDDDEIGLN